MQNSKVKIKNYGLIIVLGLLLFCSASAANAFTTTSATQEKPSLAVKIDGRKPYPGDAISALPKIEITATSTNTVQAGRIKIDGRSADLSFVGTTYRFYATYEVMTTALPDGVQTLTIEASDNYSNVTTFEIVPLYVQSAGAVTIQGVPLNFPNPFDPGVQPTSIGYNLSKPANITINILDLAGNVVAKKSCNADSPGGRAGYNEVSWDGKAGSGDYVGNGIYLYLIIADGAVAQNGRGKMTVFKR